MTNLIWPRWIQWAWHEHMCSISSPPNGGRKSYLRRAAIAWAKHMTFYRN